MRKLFKQLRKLRGIGTKGIKNASTTIDETLYGDKKPANK